MWLAQSNVLKNCVKQQSAQLMRSWLSVSTLLFFLPLTVSANDVAEKSTLASSSGFSSLMMQMLVALVFVVALLFLSAWLVKRSGMLQGSLNGQLAVLGSVSVGQREKIALIKVGQEQLVVGVTASEITLLHLLADPIEVSTNQSVQSNQASASNMDMNETFAQKLNQALSKRLTKMTKES